KRERSVESYPGPAPRAPLADANDEQRQIVGLIAGAELLYALEDPGHDGVRRGTRVAADRLDQPLLAEVLAAAARLRDAVAVGDEQVAGRKLRAPQTPLPVLERADHGGGGGQPLDRAVAAQAQRRVVAAVDVREPPRRMGEDAEEHRREVSGRSVLPQAAI